MDTLAALLERLWQDYQQLNPQAQAITELLASRHETIVNDHIALRTFDVPKVGISALAKSFLERGYQEKEHYEFPEKKLLARHYEHPDPRQPRIFISELRLALFPQPLPGIVHRLLEQIPDQAIHRWTFPVSGRLWDASYHEDYLRLAQQSEYAAWLCAFGFRANHFTVSVNHLQTITDLQQLNSLLQEHGFSLNSSGGLIKGTPADYLEQSSTLASEVEVDFRDGRFRVPGCYYEFARRYPLPDGRLFQGFVARSADKIFESTDRQQRRDAGG